MGTQGPIDYVAEIKRNRFRKQKVIHKNDGIREEFLTWKTDKENLSVLFVSKKIMGYMIINRWKFKESALGFLLTGDLQEN